LTPDLRFLYRDEEGDSVTIASDIEWREALQVMADQKIKKILIQSAQTQKKCQKQKKRNQNQPCRKNSSPQMQNPFSSVIENVQNFVPMVYHQIMSVVPESSTYAVTALNDLLKQIQDGLPVKNLAEITDYFHRIALARCEEKKYDEAKIILEVLCQVDPKNVYFSYNLACVESLLNRNPQRALELLHRSIANGYSNFKHMDKDPDFENLRSIPDFIALMNSVRAPEDNQESIPPPVIFSFEPEKQPQPEIKPQPPVVPEEIPFREELEMMKQMGFLDDDMNLAVLVSNDGDLNAAIASLL